MKLIVSPKKEIRLKVDEKFYKLLQNNAMLYGVKTGDYIVHLILDDLKSTKIPYLSLESEEIVDLGFNELKNNKSKNRSRSLSVSQIMNELK